MSKENEIKQLEKTIIFLQTRVCELRHVNKDTDIARVYNLLNHIGPAQASSIATITTHNGTFYFTNAELFVIFKCFLDTQK